MHDQIDGRLWVAHHTSLAEGLGGLLSELLVAFCKLERIQFQAPWRSDRAAC